MDYEELVAKVIELLQREKRVPYRSLKRRFALDDAYIDDLKIDLIEAKRLAVDENDRILVWAGEPTLAEALLPSPAPSTSEPVAAFANDHEREPLSYTPKHLAEKILTSRSALEGERKQVTVLFCDLANSTPLAERLGPEHMHTLLNRFFALALDAVHRYEGTINQFLGDGLMALFGAPLAHEDHARRAVFAALALQRALQEADVGKPYGEACQFRMGLNSGLVVVGSIGDNLRMDYSAIGDTTNLAARLQQQAEPGTILVSESTSRLVQGAVRLEALAPREVKGKTEPVSPYQVIGTLPRRSPIASRSERTLSPFVGRERELATLEALFAQVEAGQGQVVGIVAEAGGGKSRLLYEFRQRLQDKRVTYLEGRCVSYGSTIPYHPILDVLRNNCGISETDSPEAITEKVRFGLQEVGMDPEEFSPYVLQLLGVKEGTEPISILTPEAMRTRTFDTLKQMSLKGSQQRPLIFEIEDLHWIDKTSEDYLASLVENLVGASLLLLTSYRPGYQPAWLGKSYATQISLHSLTPQDGLTVVHSALYGETLPDQVKQMIVEKAEGNPFFLEELTRAVTEHGDFRAETTIPDTIQGVLMARIDRLPEEPKRLLQTASVLGREFSPRILKAIWEGTDSLEPLLLELKRLEFLFERSGAEESIYVFKHALTQDVAYESLLTTRRQTLHTMAGQALEQLYADRLEDAYDRLAYHYSRTDDAAKAVAYLMLVANKAASRHAHTEALAALQDACTHTERLAASERDALRFKLVLQLVNSLFFLSRFQESLDLLFPYQEHLEQHQDLQSVASYYFWLSATYTYLGNHHLGIPNAQRTITMAQRCDDAVTMGKGYYLLSRCSFWLGQLTAARSHCQQAITLLAGSTEQQWLGIAYWFLGWMSGLMGPPQPALEAHAKADAIGVAIGDAGLQALASWGTGWLYASIGEWQAGVDACQRSLALDPPPHSRANGIGFLGYTYLEKGEAAKAISLLEQALQHLQRLHRPQLQSWFMSYLGEAYLLHGDRAKAYDLGCQALTMNTDLGFAWGIGLAQRTLGRIAHTSGNLAEAARHLQDARATFDALEARYDLARTHLDLASLAYTQGNQDAATSHLSTAYAWFKTLQMPKWVERTEQLVQEYGVTLTEVALAEMTEGSS